MKRKTALAKLAALVLAFMLLSSCTQKVTPASDGKIEEGKLVVWLSPYLTGLQHSALYNMSAEDWTTVLASYSGFPDDVEYVTFEFQTEFKKALSGEADDKEKPDVILAGSKEIYYKLLKDGAFADLFPFLEAEYSRGTCFKREDILTPDFNGLTIGGKLYLFPLDFAVCGIRTTAKADRHYGIGLAGRVYTPDTIIQAYIERSKNANNRNMTGYDLLDETIIKVLDFVEYDSHTSRLTDREFCERMDALKKALKKSQIENFFQNLEQYAENLAKQPLCIRSNNGYVYTFGHGFPIRAPQQNEEWYKSVQELINEGDKSLFLPVSKTNREKEYIADCQIFGFIPKDAAHPQKAFAYIKNVFSEKFGREETLQVMPPNKKAIGALIDACQYLDDEQKRSWLEEITGASYKYGVTDYNISGWINNIMDMDTTNDDISVEDWLLLGERIQAYIDK